MHKNLLRLLKHRAYMCYWFATAFSMGASNILQFVLSLYVLKMTGSPTVFASMLSVIVVPRLILTPVGGVLGDRFSKVRALRVLNVVNILLLSGYALGIAVYGDLSLTAVFALVVALEVVEIFYQGPEAALLPEIIENDLLEEATTLSKIDNGIIWISGPMIGSFLYRQFGVHAGIIASAVCIGIAFVLNFGIKTPFAATRAPKSGERQTFRRSFVEGLQIIRRDSLLMGLIPITNLVTMSFGAVFSVVVTYLMLEVYQVSAYTYGLYRSVTASMGIWMPMLALPIVKKVKFKNLLGGASLIIAASLFFIGLSAYFAEGGHIASASSERHYHHHPRLCDDCVCNSPAHRGVCVQPAANPRRSAQPRLFDFSDDIDYRRGRRKHALWIFGGASASLCMHLDRRGGRGDGISLDRICVSERREIRCESGGTSIDGREGRWMHFCNGGSR